MLLVRCGLPGVESLALWGRLRLFNQSTILDSVNFLLLSGFLE